jgi:hypothetical protein
LFIRSRASLDRRGQRDQKVAPRGGDLEIAVGHHLLEATVFLLELTEALDVRRSDAPK